ncbi:putative cytosolic iron-sulfur protein assembly protein 1 [Xylogone sp. PMI_703]|nr:putative cytosolic iron-sulfur protein assembly protein 1 [Xylogone sp. PMI_703]
MQIAHLADFKPHAGTRAWVSIPNPNGLPLLATAISDKTARVYSLSNFTLHSTLTGGHSRSVRTVAWKPTTKKNRVLSLATGSFDATMGIWRRTEPLSGIGGLDDDELEVEVTSGSISKPKSNIDDDDDNDKSEAEEDWEFAIVLEGHDSEVKTVSYSPSSQWLASCSRDKSIWIWEEIGEEGDDEFETVAVLQEHSADVKYVCWRRDDGNGELLASGSYDNTIRFWREDGEGEWGCVAVLQGHEGTVWGLDWEPEISVSKFSKNHHSSTSTDETPDDNTSSTPRLISCSADSTIRIWSPTSPSAPSRPTYLHPGIPSTMRAGPASEEWICTATLPTAHDLPIYSVNWSPRSGRVVSTGSDSKVVVYEERWKESTATEHPHTKVVIAPSQQQQEPEEGKEGEGEASTQEKEKEAEKEKESKTEWVIIATLEGGHGPYEINHATWSKRYDNKSGKEGGADGEEEEMIITTGDDGTIKAWILVDGELKEGGQEVKR